MILFRTFEQLISIISFHYHFEFREINLKIKDIFNKIRVDVVNEMF